MKMIDLMILIYGVSGVAALVAPHDLLPSRVAMGALFLIYSAHICWRTLASKGDHDTSAPLQSQMTVAAIVR